MAVYALGSYEPKIHPDAFIHPDATVIGNVEIGSDSSIWPQAVLRGDVGKIIIGARTSIQDGTVVHCTEVQPTIIGDNCVVGAGAVVNRDVKPFELVLGVPAKHSGWMCRCANRLIDKGTVHCHCGSTYQISEEGCTAL